MLQAALAALAAACFLALWASLARASDAGTVAASATILSNSNCRFVNPGTAALNFGVLDPAVGGDVVRTATMQVRCGGPAGNATYLIVDDDGLNESGPGAHRMRHASIGTAYLPYSFSYAPASATIPRNQNRPITISGTVFGTDYQNGVVGSYADTVTLTIIP